jgi:hypothetical protein
VLSFLKSSLLSKKECRWDLICERLFFVAMQKLAQNQLSEPATIPAATWKSDGNSNAGSFNRPRRQSTPIVYTRLVDNGDGATNIEQKDRQPAARPRPFLKHKGFSLSDCDITLAREIQQCAPSRSARLRTEKNFESKEGDIDRVFTHLFPSLSS